jgi:diacylglycerol kinase family enzyme
LVAYALALVLVVAGLLDNTLALIVGALCMTLAFMAAYVALVSRGTVRWVATGAAAALVVAVVVEFLIRVDFLRLVPIVVVSSVAVVASRAAIRPGLVDVARTVGHERSVETAVRPVLFVNPESGGGKAERFDLLGECRRRQIEPVVLERGDNLEALAEKAARSGADVIGMAGGDGSQALVAGVASRHAIAHACVPAGTRNHLALDLGLDRDDVVGALDAYGNAIEATIDIAAVNGLTFVNNVSLGIYATVVQSDAYRNAKVATTLGQLPDLLGRRAEPFRLRFTTPDGEQFNHAHVIQVSNNPYALHAFVGAGSRPRLDGGVLGVATLRIDRAADVPTLLALVKAGRVQSFRGFREWTATSFRVDADEPVAAGVDGEAATLQPPLLFETHPAALRVRIPRHAHGLSPGALAGMPMTRRLGALLRVVAGRPA